MFLKLTFDMTRVCVDNLTFQSLRIFGIVSSAKLSEQRISVTTAAEFHFEKRKAPVTLSDTGETEIDSFFLSIPEEFFVCYGNTART